jgi:hypothetical protein
MVPNHHLVRTVAALAFFTGACSGAVSASSADAGRKDALAGGDAMADDGPVRHDARTHDVEDEGEASCAHPAKGLHTIATRQSFPYPIVAQDGWIYWSSTGLGRGQTGAIVKTPSYGGTATTLATNADGTALLAVDDTSVYWEARGGSGKPSAIMETSLAGGVSRTLIGDQDVLGGLVAAHGVLYWTGASTVKSMPVTGKTAHVLASGQASPITVAVDSTSVYWTNAGATTMTNTEGAVMKTSLSGGEPTTLAGPYNLPQWLVLDGGFVYFTATNDGTVMRVPIAGGKATTLAHGQPWPEQIVTDGESLYWSNILGGLIISKMPLKGGTVRTLVARGRLRSGGDPSCIALDCSSLYFTDYNEGEVVRLTPDE